MKTLVSGYDFSRAARDRGFTPARGVTGSRTRQTLFTIAYGCVLFQFLAMLGTTLAVIELDAPGVVQTAALFGSVFLGVAALVVMTLRPMLERELVGEKKRAEG